MVQGCKSGEQELGEIGSLFLDYINLLDEENEFFCECNVEQGYYKDLEECWAASGGPAFPPILAACYAYALDGVDAASEFVSCEEARHDDYLACLQKEGCDGELGLCGELLWAGETCPPLPLDAQAAIAKICHGYTLPRFTCEDGTQIPSWFECDAWIDCPDGSDEHEGCPPPPWMFECESGDLIDEWLVCNGWPDCPDGDDEANCPNSFECQSGDLIPHDLVCNGWADCPDGDDELGCPTYECQSGDTIPQSWVCDGLAHCPDGDDELDCPPTTYECESGDVILAKWVCDGEADCPDGDDELDCP